MKDMGIMLVGTAMALGLAASAAAADTSTPLPIMGKAFSTARPIAGGVRPGTTIHRWGPRV